MSKVVVAVKLRIKSGQRDAFTEAVKPGLATAQSESGTLTYIFHHDAVDADVVWFYEMYADQDSLNAHMGSDAFKAFSKVQFPHADWWQGSLSLVSRQDHPEPPRSCFA